MFGRSLCFVLITLPVHSAVNFCCNKVEWGSNWCTRGDCYGLGCRKGESRRGLVCPDLSDCICKGLGYKTINKCTVAESCSVARDDVQFGSEMVKLYTGRIPDDRCIDALRVGVFMCCVVGWTPSEKTIPATLFLERPVASQYSFFFLSLDFFAVPVSLALALSRNIFF